VPDFQVTTETLRNERDYRWLVPSTDIANTQGGTLLIAGATQATHYPDGYIKPGTLLARYTSGANDGLLAPFVVDGSTGLDTCVGIVMAGFYVRRERITGTVIGTVTTGAFVPAGIQLQVSVGFLPGLLTAAAAAHVPVAGNLPASFIVVTN
jgi:hypothetical protein